MRYLILYSTLGCHLCDHAKAVVWPVLEGRDIELVETDIADSVSLMAAYGTSIPVVEYSVSGEKLFWPFDEAQVKALLSAIEE